MNPKNRIVSLKNSADYYLRSKLRWGRQVPKEAPPPELDTRLQAEFEAFVTRFNWPSLLKRFTKSEPLIVADIGARNFVFGPVLDRVFEKAGRKAEIHGIEIDAFRLLKGFRSRKNFGDYYASKMRQGYFHAMDFLKWNEPLDIAFLLNPFVSEEPTLSWGLPLSTLKPQKIFDHTFHCLKPKRGLMILSCPSLEELVVAKELATKAGFTQIAEAEWHPPKVSVQQKPRLGIAYRLA